MDPRLLRVYNEELAYLRESAREFGAEHDVVAGYLGLKTPNDPDPYVERLLEGVAFLAARVNLKLQDQFPEFTQHLLQAVQPNYLAPTPSMCVVGFDPQIGDDALAKGIVVPRQTALTASVADHDTQVRFLTSQEVRLFPLIVAEAEYLPSRAMIGAYAAAANVRAESGLRLRIQAAGGAPLAAISPGLLPVFLAGSEAIPGELYRQLCGEAVAVVARPVGGTGSFIGLPKPEPYGFDDAHAVLPHEGRSFRGYRLLSEYFACPERFLFAAFSGLGKAFAACERACEIVVLFSRSSPALTGAVTPANFRLYATPAVNLFEMQIGRIAITPYEHEYPVIVDRTRPIDYEVFRLLSVEAHAKSGPVSAVAPLYAFGALLYDWQDAMFYTTRMALRRLSKAEQRRRRRADYVGTDVFLSLTSPGNPERLRDIRELSLRALVTNRELPESLRFGGTQPGFSVSGFPVSGVPVLRAPTRPRPPLGVGDAAWRVIGHLAPNYASLFASQDGDPGALRDHLALYGRSDDAAMRRQIDGILSLASEHVTRRMSGSGGPAFARGHSIKIKLDDASFDNGRMFLFSAILDRFLSEFCSINSFVETVFESPNQGEFARWPTRAGQRPTI